MNFNPTEQSILSIVQDDLPDSLTPYADLARQTASSEDVVIELLTRLKKNGVIRRFGASIKHQRTGWANNAMVAWVADPDFLDEAGRQAASHPLISHCYYRPSSAPDWPYTFYTMLHGKDWSDCESTIEFLQDIPGLGEHAVLKSIKELKKISMRYFQNSAK